MAAAKQAIATLDSGVVLGLQYFDVSTLEFDLGSFSDHATSGRTSVALGTLAPGDHVVTARVRVAGEAFHGKLQDFAGTRITQSPLVYNADGGAEPAIAGQRAYVIDFGGVRTVLGLKLGGGSARIVLVLPWAGTDFAQKPIYPIGGAFSFYALPRPDPSGKTSVGFPAVDSAKLFVQLGGSGLPDAAQFAQTVRIVSGVLPANLRASVNGRPVFFTHPGPLDRQIELSGLADELNALAATLDGATPAALELASDTPGALLPSFDTATDRVVDTMREARWAGRDRIEVALQALDPAPVELLWPAEAALSLRRFVVTLGGSFPRWRAFGPVGAPAGKLALRIDARFSVARRVVLPGRCVLHGLALPLQADAAAELRLELVADAAGAPADAPPLATAELKLDGSGAGPPWIETMFATPLDSGGVESLWLLLKGKRGNATWSATSEPAAVPPATLFTNEGGRWQRYPVRQGQSPAPLLRVLREPLARENAPLATLSWAGSDGTALSLGADPSDAAPATLEFAAPAAAPLPLTPLQGSVATTLTVTAAASGTLLLRRASGFFGR